MVTVTSAKPLDITLPAGNVLFVKVGAGCYGTVWHLPDTDLNAPSFKHDVVSAAKPVTLGPFDRQTRYRIEAVSGSVEASWGPSTVTALAATLPRATEIISTAANIAEGIRMTSIQDKFKHLADRARQVPAALSAKADEVLSRLDAVEARGGTAFDKLHGVVNDADQGVAAAEDALNQLTNGAPAGPN
jgi:hypothetical protein